MRQFATLICSRGNGEFDVADTSENALSDYAVGSQEISQHPEHQHLHRD